MTDKEVWLEAIIKANSNRRALAKILSVDEQVLVGAGDNYLSQVKKIVVRAVRNDGEIVKKSYILKELPSSVNTRAMIQQGGYNFIESICYRDVLSSMENLLNEKELTDEPLWPDCINVQPYETILLEDLTVRGYKMANRHEGLDFEHCSLVMQNLGMFHALGLVLKERGVLAKIAFGDHFIVRNRKDMHFWLDKGFKKLLDSMENWGDEWKAYKTKLENKLSTYNDDIINLHMPKDDGLTVLAHGDCWVNNMIFKHNIYTGKPVLMRFLDFQITCMSSLALDLTYFFVGSSNMDVRRHHKQNLLKIYHDSLVFNMSRLGVSETPPSFEYIQSEMKRLSFLNIHYMVNLLPIIYKKKGEAFDFEGVLEEFKEVSEAAARGKEVKAVKDWLDDFDDNLVTIFKMIIKEVESDLKF